MKKSHLIAFLVVAALGGYLAYDLRSETKETERKEQEARLFAFPADQVNELTVTKGAETFTVARSEDGWKIKAPFEDRADDFFTDDFVKRLAEEKIIGTAKSGEGIEWSVYGLDQPLGKFTLKLQNGQDKTLLVSGKKNFEQNSFARLEGDDRALIVNPAWVSHLDRTTLDFRDKRVLRAKIGDVRTLKVKTPKESFSLERTDNTWSVQGQTGIQLDQNRIRELLSMINETRAEDFKVTGTPTEAQRRTYGLNRPLVTIQARIGDDRNWSVEFARDSKAQEFAFVSDPAFVLGLEAGTLAKFENTTLDGLRDKKKPFDVSLDAAQKIHWQTPVKKTTFSKKNGQWSIDGNASEEQPDSAKVQSFMAALQEARATRYADSSEVSSFRPVNHLTVSDEQGKTLFEISWAAQTLTRGKDRTRLAKTNLLKDIFHLSEDNLSKWSPADLMPSATEPTEAAEPQEQP
ncbi:MAG: DUF4340 domain-containing protein [Bdellovibrionaceae bacterium]|nr:DUF4340 domain-containing protein [Pseudobdellovibrionaceae bacterium]